MVGRIRLGAGWWLVYWLSLLSSSTLAATASPYQFSDAPQLRELSYPDWFMQSFLDLPNDLQLIRQQHKLGLAVYFGQANCPYCEALLEVNFAQHMDIAQYMQRYFMVLAVDINGSLQVTDLDGQLLDETTYADKHKVNFTPTLIFYSEWGQEIFRMRGYYPPYRFRAMLDYLVGGFYLNENFRRYFERAAPPMAFDDEVLTPHPLFSKPPYWLQRNAEQPAARPLLVLFEQADCHACDLLHGEALDDTQVQGDLAQMEVVQLNLWGDTPVVTPQGQNMSARAWAKDLGLYYTPSLLFFDEQGQEIIRIDSVVQLHRLRKILGFVLTKAYQHTTFPRWRKE